MNCCNHNDEHHDNHQKKGHMSHLWMMVLCCGAPLLALLLISFLGSGFPAVSAFLAPIVPFLCPVLMIGMIPMMLLKGRHRDDGGPKPEEIESGEEEEHRY